MSEIKGIAVRSQVLEYVDPEGSESEPTIPKFPKYSDYVKVVSANTPGTDSTNTPTPAIVASQGSSQGTVLGDSNGPPVLIPEPCSRYADLSESQKESYNADERSHRGLQADARAAAMGIEKVHTIILESAKDYVARNVRSSSVR